MKVNQNMKGPCDLPQHLPSTKKAFDAENFDPENMPNAQKESFLHFSQ